MCKSGCWSSPKEISRLLTRVFFGLSLFFVGVVHYKTVADFAAFVGDGLGTLSMIGTAWGYVLPGLMIVGGALFVIGKFPKVAVWTAGIALGSIPAGILFKSVITEMPLGDTMPGAVNAFTWLIVYMFAVKAFCKCETKKCCDGKEKGNCVCGPDGSCKGDCKDGCCK